MKILKIINNNIISALDNNNNEIIVMGKGIGYNAKHSGVVAEDDIEKVFYVNENNIDQLKKLFSSLPQEHIEIANEVIKNANETLSRKLNDNVYVTLTDHISFAIKRFEENMTFSNALNEEVRIFYGREYSVGLFALRLIKSSLGIDLPPDEASSVAMHLLNAQYDTSMSEAFRLIGVTEDIVDSVSDIVGYRLTDNDYSVNRFLTFAKYLARGIVKDEENNKTDDKDLLDAIYPMYISYINKAENVKKYIQGKYGYKLSDEELAYLAIHLKKLSKE